ncbi:MAG: TonB-dependent receptor [Gammaproteobacteria bacterium]|nr:TonB-dependent receptor [Gammaproteobacteria bacterium]
MEPIRIARRVAASTLTATLLASTLTAAAEEAREVPNLTVIGQRDEMQRVTVDPLNTPLTLPTTGELMKRTPGGNVNFNGPLTGVGQYRGMFAYRINTQIDDMPVTVGGPNWMDAPLHNAPMPLLDSLEVQRGITPVSAGSETIGGNVRASKRSSEFGATGDFGFHGNVNASAQTVDGGYGIGAVVAGSNDTHRLHASGVVEKGDDTEFPGGKIRPTEYDRTAWGLGYGLSAGDHELGLDYSRNETTDSGTPALPMDIRFIDTNVIGGKYIGTFGGTSLTARLNYNDVEHGMDNFTLRAPPPDPARYRQNLAKGDGTSFELSALTRFRSGKFAYGIDGDLNNHDSRITNPNNAMFFVEAFNNVKRDRVGLFGEWSTPIDDTWSYEVGGRYTQVNADAGAVNGTPAMMMPPAQSLRDEFNAADRKLDWDLVDAVGKFYYRVSDSLRLDLGLGHKERAPVYQELYLWLPLRATAGLADGKNYVGNLDLKQEKSNIVDIGLDWRAGGSFFGPRLFYKRVDDYIQGTPSTDPRVIMISTMNGDPNPLQFANVDAEFYGFDADFGIQLPASVRIDGVLSYVRGKRRDIGDNLYRIAPLTSIIGLTVDRNRWSATLEGQFASEQDKVSATNEETPTAGYGIANLYGSFRGPERILITAGVNNLFDKEYRDHTNGVNRARNSDVAVGQRMPGPGRSFFARLSYNW